LDVGLETTAGCYIVIPPFHRNGTNECLLARMDSNQAKIAIVSVSVVYCFPSYFCIKISDVVNRLHTALTFVIWSLKEEVSFQASLFFPCCLIFSTECEETPVASAALLCIY
jgi:hypothetical protein